MLQSGAEVGSNLWDYVHRRFPEDKEFPSPTFCLVNGKATLREDWGKPLDEEDVVIFVAHIGDVVTIIYYAIVLIVSVAITLAMDDPAIPGSDAQKGDPAYNLSGQQNRIRLSEPIESHYGRCRIWPSYGARPYNQYIGNDQYQYSLFCLGQGEYTISPSEVYLEDTPITSFEDVEVEITPPGGSITLFPDNVTTSVEVSNIQLFGTNEVDYPSPDGWYGGFVINEAGTTIDRVEFDVVAPNGMFALYEGARLQQVAAFEFQVRPIDDDGVATGAWATVVTSSIQAATTTPQRRTVASAVTSGRYEARGRRTNTRNTSASVNSDIYWEALRGFKASTKVYGDVTMVAVKALATNNLNNNTRSRFNVFATRKLRKWNTATQLWNVASDTRNPVWAALDVLQAEYGAQLADSFFPLDTWKALADVYDANETYFDFTFDQSIGAWDAVKTILRVGRAVPMLQGSQVTAIQDGTRTIVEGVFNRENIIKDSLRWEIALTKYGEYDGLSIEYVDPQTWKPEELDCSWPGDTNNNPERIILAGCTNRQQAFEEGKVLRGMRLRNRENVIFQTGLEGFIPSYGALVAVTHDVLRRGYGGFIVSVEVDDKTINLSEPVKWIDGMEHVFILRRGDGSGTTYAVESIGASDKQIVLVDAIGGSILDEMVFDGSQVPPYYTFGAIGIETFKGKVVNIQPSETDAVEITVVEYRPEIYQYDGVTVTPKVEVVTPPVDEDSDVSNIVINPIEGRSSFVNVTWKPAPGSLQYIIEVAYDEGGGTFSAWDRVATVPWTVTSYDVPITPGDVKVRIAAVRRRRGGFSTSTVQTVGIDGSVPAAVVMNTPTAFTGLTASIGWQPVAQASSYTVQVYKSGGAMLRELANITTPLSFDYTLSDMNTDDATPERDLEFRVKAVNTAGASDVVTSYLSNPSPAALTSPASLDVGGGDYDLSWDAVAGPPADFDEYRVYASTTPGFTPGPGNLVYSGATPATTIAVGVTTYWRVAAFDLWARDHADANFTSEQTITI